MTPMTLAAIFLLNTVSVASEPAGLTEATVTVGDLCVGWSTHRGMTVEYRGARAFDAYPGEFTLHDKAWKKSFYSSHRGGARATLSKRGGARVLDIADDAEHFAYRKTVTVGPDARLVQEFQYMQKDLDDAALQLGWRPVVAWLEGAAYRVVAGGKEERGHLGAGWSGRDVLWSGITELEFTSAFGSWRMRTTHPMILYDYRKRGEFWLGWDTALEKGKQYNERVEFTFAPGRVEREGIRLTDLSWSREINDGYFRLSGKLSRLAGGPEVVGLVVTLKRGEEEVGSTRQVIKLTPTLTEAKMERPLAEPGKYVAEVRFVGDGDKELLALPALDITVERIFTAVAGLSLYTSETQGELILRLGDKAPVEGLVAVVRGAGLSEAPVPVQKGETVVPFSLAAVPEGLHNVAVELRRGEDVVARALARFVKAPPAAHEVKIDNRTRGLLVDGKPFFPFGFYTHSGRFYDTPMADLLPETEAADKFNLICVYHPGTAEMPELMPLVHKFMDRCDAVGMKNHYDVCHYCDEEPTPENEAGLEAEMKAVREAPSLLCWYLSDEPCGRNLPPERFIKRYPKLKQWDPYHPTTMVFCVPEKADLFVPALDIMMVDPYPIPSAPVTRVAETIDLVRRESFDEVPVWCVPQAFGGGEWWGREPTPEEERCMTYLSIVHGATGIQYFIRRPPGGNPFVPALWGEIRRMAQEIKELTPVLLSHDPRPTVEVRVPGEEVHAAAWSYRGRAYVIAVNTVAQPTSVTLRCSVAPAAGEREARVLGQQRSVPVTADGSLRDMLDAFGVRIYEYAMAAQPDLELAGNLLHNGSFEDQTNIGYPDYYHVSQGQAPGWSWGTDPLEAHHGEHSLFLRCPADGKGPGVTSYPLSLKPGKYEASAWYKYDRAGAKACLQVSGFANAPSAEAEVGPEWGQLKVEFEVPEGTRWVHVSFSGLTRGTLWVDEVVVRSLEPAE